MPRFLALFLALSLILPSPSFALRGLQPVNSGTEEELTASLQASGAEERFNPGAVLLTRDVGERKAIEFIHLMGQRKRPVVLALGDADWLSVLNRIYSKRLVNVALTRIFQTLAEETEKLGGFAYRIGGDEFGIVLPLSGPVGAREENNRQAYELLNRIREKIAQEFLNRYVVVFTRDPKANPAVPNDLILGESSYGGRRLFLLEVPRNGRYRTPEKLLRRVLEEGKRKFSKFSFMDNKGQFGLLKSGKRNRPVTVSIGGRVIDAPHFAESQKDKQKDGQAELQEYRRLMFLPEDWLKEAKSKDPLKKNIVAVGQKALEATPHHHEGRHLLAPASHQDHDVRRLEMQRYLPADLDAALKGDFMLKQSGILLKIGSEYSVPEVGKVSVNLRNGNGGLRFKWLNEVHGYTAGDDAIKLLLSKVEEVFTEELGRSKSRNPPIITVSRAPEGPDQIRVRLAWPPGESLPNSSTLQGKAYFNLLEDTLSRVVAETQKKINEYLDRYSNVEGFQVHLDWVGTLADLQSNPQLTWQQHYDNLAKAAKGLEDPQKRFSVRDHTPGFLYDPQSEELRDEFARAEERVDHQNSEQALREIRKKFAAGAEESEAPLHVFQTRTPVHALGVSRNENLIVSAGENRFISVWDPVRKRRVENVPGRGAASSLAFSPDGRFFGLGTFEGNVLLFRTGEEKAVSWKLQRAAQSGIGRARDSLTILRVGFDQSRLLALNKRGRMDVWTLPSQGDPQRENQVPIELRTAEEKDTANLQSAVFHPHQALLASAEQPAGRVRIWRISGLEVQLASEFFPANSKLVNSLAFSPQADVIAVGRGDGRVELRAVSDGKPLNVLDGSHRGFISSLAFNENGEVLAVGDTQGKISLWKVSDGSLIGFRYDHFEIVSSLAFSADGKILVSGGWDGRIIVWNAPVFPSPAAGTEEKGMASTRQLAHPDREVELGTAAWKTPGKSERKFRIVAEAFNGFTDLRLYEGKDPIGYVRYRPQNGLIEGIYIEPERRHEGLSTMLGTVFLRAIESKILEGNLEGLHSYARHPLSALLSGRLGFSPEEVPGTDSLMFEAVIGRSPDGQPVPVYAATSQWRYHMSRKIETSPDWKGLVVVDQEPDPGEKVAVYANYRLSDPEKIVALRRRIADERRLTVDWRPETAAGAEEISLRELGTEGALFDVYGAETSPLVYKALKQYSSEEADSRGISAAIEDARNGLAVAQDRLGGLVLPAAAFEDVTLRTEGGERDSAYTVAQRKVPAEWFLDRVVRELVQRGDESAIGELAGIFSALKELQDELHWRGVVHLDTRLSNYVRDDTGKLWIADTRLLTPDPSRFDITTHQSTQFNISLDNILREESRENLLDAYEVTGQVFGDYDALTELADSWESRSLAPGRPMFRGPEERQAFETEAAKAFIRAPAAGGEEEAQQWIAPDLLELFTRFNNGKPPRVLRFDSPFDVPRGKDIWTYSVPRDKWEGARWNGVMRFARDMAVFKNDELMVLIFREDSRPTGGDYVTYQVIADRAESLRADFEEIWRGELKPLKYEFSIGLTYFPEGNHLLISHFPLPKGIVLTKNVMDATHQKIAQKIRADLPGAMVSAVVPRTLQTWFRDSFGGEQVSFENLLGAVGPSHVTKIGASLMVGAVPMAGEIPPAVPPAAGTEEGIRLFDGSTSGTPSGEVLFAQDLLPQRVALAGLETGGKWLVVPSSENWNGARVYLGPGIRLDPEVAQRIGPERIVRLQGGVEEVRAFLDAEVAAGRRGMALLDVAAGMERDWAPDGIGVVNISGSLAPHLSLSQLAGLETALRLQGDGILRINGAVQRDWEEPIEVLSLAA